MSSNPVTIPDGKRLGTLLCVDNVDTVRINAPLNAKQRSDKLTKILAEMKFDAVLPHHPNERAQLRQLIIDCLDAFSADDNDIGNVQVTEFVIDTGTHAPLRPVHDNIQLRTVRLSLKRSTSVSRVASFGPHHLLGPVRS